MNTCFSWCCGLRNNWKRPNHPKNTLTTYQNQLFCVTSSCNQRLRRLMRPQVRQTFETLFANSKQVPGTGPSSRSRVPKCAQVLPQQSKQTWVGLTYTLTTYCVKKLCAQRKVQTIGDESFAIERKSARQQTAGMKPRRRGVEAHGFSSCQLAHEAECPTFSQNRTNCIADPMAQL